MRACVRACGLTPSDENTGNSHPSEKDRLRERASVRRGIVCRQGYCQEQAFVWHFQDALRHPHVPGRQDPFDGTGAASTTAAAAAAAAATTTTTIQTITTTATLLLLLLLLLALLRYNATMCIFV